MTCLHNGGAVVKFVGKKIYTRIMCTTSSDQHNLKPKRCTL